MVFGALVVSKIIYIFKIRLDNEIRYQNKKKWMKKILYGKLTQKVEVSMFAQAFCYKWFEYVNQVCN